MKRFISFAGLLGILMMMSTLAFAYDKGDRVLALWEDAYWYPGTVVAVDGNVLTIAFDDGDKAELTVRVCRQSRASRLVGR